MKKTVKCPTCGKPTEYSQENPNRPFCSDRCRVLDLGAWADEKYRMPEQDSEIEAVNENRNSVDSAERQASNPPPKHLLN